MQQMAKSMGLQGFKGPADKSHTFSSEDIKKAVETKRRLRAERLATPIKLKGLLDFPIQRTQAWERLAAERGLRMPGWDEKITTARVLFYLRKIGVSRGDCAEWLGGSKGTFPTEFAQNNPRWALYALIGTILENVTPGDAELYREKKVAS